MRIIDAHCHLGIGVDKRLEPEKLLRIMDEAGVHTSVICPIEQYIAVDNEEGNKYIYDIVKKYNGRFAGFCSVNPWYLDKAAAMLRAAFEAGFAGLKLNPKLQGFTLCDDIVNPLIEICEEYKAPVYFHTGTMICAEPFQLRELAVRYPGVNFIMGHSGNTDFWTDIAYSTLGHANIYLETSHNLNIRMLIDAAGIDHVVFGSNMPRSHQLFELGKIRDLSLPDKDFSKLCGGNIEMILRKLGAT